jgi:chromosome condensin MukBEF ATPase and DNA-binding subunit MukB
MTDPEPGKPEPGPDAGVEDIQAHIEATRNELGQTVEALSAKLDVKHQAKQKVDHTKELIVDKAQDVRSKGSEVGSQVINSATDDKGSIRPAVPVAALALAVVIVGVVIWRRRR